MLVMQKTLLLQLISACVLMVCSSSSLFLTFLLTILVLIVVSKMFFQELYVLAVMELLMRLVIFTMFLFMPIFFEFPLCKLSEIMWLTVWEIKNVKEKAYSMNLQGLRATCAIIFLGEMQASALLFPKEVNC